jgi:hypothetical protein
MSSASVVVGHQVALWCNRVVARVYVATSPSSYLDDSHRIYQMQMPFELGHEGEGEAKLLVTKLPTTAVSSCRCRECNTQCDKPGLSKRQGNALEASKQAQTTFYADPRSFDLRGNFRRSSSAASSCGCQGTDSHPYGIPAQTQGDREVGATI